MVKEFTGICPLMHTVKKKEEQCINDNRIITMKKKQEKREFMLFVLKVQPYWCSDLTKAVVFRKGSKGYIFLKGDKSCCDKQKFTYHYIYWHSNNFSKCILVIRI